MQCCVGMQAVVKFGWGFLNNIIIYIFVTRKWNDYKRRFQYPGKLGQTKQKVGYGPFLKFSTRRTVTNRDEWLWVAGAFQSQLSEPRPCHAFNASRQQRKKLVATCILTVLLTGQLIHLFYFRAKNQHSSQRQKKWAGFSVPCRRLWFNAAFDEGGSQRLMEALTTGSSGSGAGRAKAPPFSMIFVLKRTAFFITEATEIKCDGAERKWLIDELKPNHASLHLPSVDVRVGLVS